MDADITDAAAEARLGRVDPPFRLFADCLASEPALRILDHDLADGADFPCGDPRARFAYQRVSRVGVGDAEGPACRFDERGQFMGFAKRRGQRLVGDDRVACSQSCPRRRQVIVVRGDDRDKIDPVFARCFGCEHRVERGVGTGRIDAVAFARRSAAARIAREHACDQFDLAVKLCCKAMHGADKRPRTATNHSHPQSAHRSLLFGKRVLF